MTPCVGVKESQKDVRELQGNKTDSLLEQEQMDILSASTMSFDIDSMSLGEITLDT